MEVKRQHINFIIILCFIWGCGGDKPTTPEQTFPEITYSPGQSYGDALGYVEYLVGNTPIIITVPHDGTLSPSSIADRTYGTMVRDTNSRKVAERFAYFFVQNSGGLYPHIVYSNLHRRKLDPNRLERIQPITNRAVFFNSNRIHRMSKMYSGTREMLASTVWKKIPLTFNQKA